MTASAPRQPAGALSIGAVLAQLRPDFPDVTISKIRFLESEGLVQPARTASGYRQFTHIDIERLRFVLAAQRDHYLPLKVIKEQLESVEAGATPSDAQRRPRALSSVPAPGLPGPEAFEPGPPDRLTREDLLARAEIDGTLLAELEDYGLIRPGPAGFYDLDALAVATVVRAMAAHGIQPRHLRAFRGSADREVGLLEQIVGPLYRQRDATSRGRADEVARELAALSVGLHTLLVKIGLRHVSGQ